MSDKKLKAIVIGLGGQNLEDHLPAILESDDVILDSICDVNLAAVAEISDRYNVPGYSNIDHLLAEREPDFAIVAVPHNQYLSIITKLAAKKIHILKEKPFATSLSEAKEIDRIIKLHNIKFMVAVQRRFSNIYKKFDEYKLQIGKIYSIHGHYTLNIPRLDVGWRSSKTLAGGGALIDMGYHIIDLVTWYFGLPDTVNARLSYRNKDGQNYDVEDTAKVLFDYIDNESGHKILGSLLLSRIYPNKQEQLTVYGTEGNIEIRKTEISLVSKEKEVIESFTSNKSLAVKKQLKFFVNLIRDEQKTDFNYEEHFKNVAFIESAYISDETSITQFPSKIAHYTLTNQKFDVIENYLSKIKDFKKFPRQIKKQIVDVFLKTEDYSHIKDYFVSLKDINSNYELGNLEQICNEVRDLLLSITGEIETKHDINSNEIFAKSNRTQFQKSNKSLDWYLKNGVNLKINSEFLSVLESSSQNAQHLPLFEKLKGDRLLSIGEFTNSRLMYSAHDTLDHLWSFNELRNAKLFEKYKSFFNSIGDPIGTDIFKREAELVSTIGFGLRRFKMLKQNLPSQKISINQIKELISNPELTSNQQDALGLLQSVTDSCLLDKISYIIYNMSVQIPDERRRWGVIKIKDEQGDIQNMPLLDPEYLSFIVEAVYTLSQKDFEFSEAEFKFCLIFEEFLQKVTQRSDSEINLKLSDIDNFNISNSKLHKDHIQWIKNNIGFSTIFY